MNSTISSIAYNFPNGSPNKSSIEEGMIELKHELYHRAIEISSLIRHIFSVLKPLQNPVPIPSITPTYNEETEVPTTFPSHGPTASFINEVSLK